ncbi:MAG: hypothetical protein KGV44_12835 [Flavobacteriaceae bacterium]|nr:hypothetical protein [Flavobacteriaceae bacterium]
MKFLESFNKIIKHIGTVKKVSDTLVLVVRHLEEITPKLRDIWFNDKSKVNESV